MAKKAIAKKAAKPKRARSSAARPKTAKPRRAKTAATAHREKAKKARGKAPAGPRARHRLKSPFTKRELVPFRKMLLAKRHDLIGDMNGVEAGSLGVNRQEGSGDLSNMPTHPADIGTDSYEQEFTLGLLESERILLAEINEALDRIEGGTYGICLGTDKAITKTRLRARPWAKYCIKYARLIEKGLAQPREEQDEDEEEDEEGSAE